VVAGADLIAAPFQVSSGCDQSHVVFTSLHTPKPECHELALLRSRPVRLPVRIMDTGNLYQLAAPDAQSNTAKKENLVWHTLIRTGPMVRKTVAAH
jgi:hypothetical protein